ncbi:hypothetical protein EP56_05680 [Listeriaceae bacterium FSL A5-0209]|nr:hypothetical protein EP56_05680 [Listeriaceae bacterium FSL A5-0209]
MIIYHTETQEDYDALMVEFEGKGVTWFGGEKPTYKSKWNEYKMYTCIEIDGNKITYADYDYFITKGSKIEKYKADDNVNKPSHYQRGGIETLDFIKAKLDYEPVAISNVIKYVSRYKDKNGIEDLKKAQYYLNDVIEWMEQHPKQTNEVYDGFGNLVDVVTHEES